jgi:hypothetical protein
MSDPDGIDVEIAGLITTVATLRRREQKYLVKAAGQGGNSLERNQRGVARYQAARAAERREAAEARLQILERRREEAMQRNRDDVMPTDTGSWPWRVWSGRLNLGGRVFNRGQIVPDELVTSSLNGAKLVQAGAIRRLPASPIVAPVVKNLPTEKREGPPTAPVDPEYQTLCAAQDAVRDAADKRHTDRRSAVDLIDRGLLDRAGCVWGAWPRMAMVGGWGSAGGVLKRVGAGALGVTSRHSDDFISMLISDHRPPPRLASEARAS